LRLGPCSLPARQFSEAAAIFQTNLAHHAAERSGASGAGSTTPVHVAADRHFFAASASAVRLEPRRRAAAERAKTLIRRRFLWPRSCWGSASPFSPRSRDEAPELRPVRAHNRAALSLGDCAV